MSIRFRWGAALLATVLLAFPVPALDAQERAPLDHDAYEIWRTIGAPTLSPDGAWVAYTLDYQNDDGELVVRGVDSGIEHRVPRGAAPTFDPASGHLVFTIQPRREAVREARSERGNRSAAPRDSLGILNLGSGEITRIPGIRSFRVAEEGAARLVVHLHSGNDDEERRGALLVQTLSGEEPVRIEDVTGYELAPNGNLVLFSTDPGKESDQGAADEAGVHVFRPDSGEATTLLEAAGSYGQLTLDDAGEQAAFLFAPEAEGDDDPEHVLHHWRAGDAEARPVVDSGTRGLPGGWWIGEHGGLSFSPNGERLFFGTSPRPVGVNKEDRSALHHDEVEVDVWHWQDGDLMSVQRVRRNQERRRTYRAVLHLRDSRVVQLADEGVPTVGLHRDGDGDLAVAGTTVPYAIMASWESPNPRDLYLIDVESGDRELVAEMSRGFPSLSPEGRYMAWWENADSTWYVRDVESGHIADVSSAIPHPLFNEDHDAPSPAGSYGTAGWLKGDEALILYDRYDIWAVDPSGGGAPRSLTRGQGRAADVRFRLIRLDPDAEAWATDRSVLLSAFDLRTKDAGFYRTRLDRERSPDRLVMEPRLFSTPVKAKDSDRILFTQQTFRDFPDLWVAGTDLGRRTRVSDANPQQSEYRWGTAELMEWVSGDGVPLQGILLKPDDFDPERQYPLMVYFYDRSSDGLHRHYAPVPHRSIINFPMYTSNDYVVFIPDIVYRIGYPGESAVNSVNPGVFQLLDRGFIDRERIGLQGHSWGGYQIAFMVTRSRDLYRAAAPGAPVANMTSAYGGIRRETGLVRQFQYERTQSRLGGTLWEMPLRYIENSPLFWVDKIETPLLIMHNDRDGHVPWEQGIELFVALRRLGKPAWMINYNDEPHWPTSFANRRDWNIRMKQFFDHFLKDAPPPVWMVQGIPAVQKGETLGLELVEEAPALDGRR